MALQSDQGARGAEAFAEKTVVTQKIKINRLHEVLDNYQTGYEEKEDAARYWEDQVTTHKQRFEELKKEHEKSQEEAKLHKETLEKNLSAQEEKEREALKARENERAVRERIITLESELV